MVEMATLKTLAELEMEMGRAGRPAEEGALRQALRTLTRRERALLTTGEAAQQLRISIPTVKRWIRRGALTGGSLAGRWLVSRESVDRLARVRAALLDLDREGNPSPDDIRLIEARASRRPEVPGAGAPDH